MLPCFNYLWDLFYIDKVKTIPSNIGDILTKVGLAFWIMDDGGFTAKAREWFKIAYKCL